MANTAYTKFIDFFKRHNLYDEKIFNYLQENSVMFDYRDEDSRPFIGCYYSYSKDNKLQKITLCVPFIDDDITTLINIHEYIHGILMYNKIGYKFKTNIDCEILPMLYERIFIEETQNEELNEYLEYLNQKVLENPKPEYQLALSIQDELLEEYNKNNNIKKLNKKIKKLTKQTLQ